jgi:hypothetical protein
VEVLGLLLVVHVVVICGLFAARALHGKLAPLADTDVAAAPRLLPAGRQLEEYVQAGLDDLRLMLVEAARRRD